MISKCLGCMNDIAMLSEVHPFTFAEPFNPLTQAINYHHLLNEADIASLQTRGETTWPQAIRLIARRARSKKKHLLIRDWSHLDYTGVPWIPNPGYRLSTAEILAEHFDIKHVATVRHPIDQWLSLEKLGLVRGKIDIPTFLRGYRAFAEKSAEIGFVRFEDFTQDPKHWAKLLCEQLAIPFDPSFIDKWSNFTKITGDVGQNGAGRATKADEIRPLTRRNPSPELAQTFESCADFAPALKLLNYSI